MAERIYNGLQLRLSGTELGTIIDDQLDKVLGARVEVVHNPIEPEYEATPEEKEKIRARWLKDIDQTVEGLKTMAQFIDREGTFIIDAQEVVDLRKLTHHVLRGPVTLRRRVRVRRG